MGESFRNTSWRPSLSPSPSRLNDAGELAEPILALRSSTVLVTNSLPPSISVICTNTMVRRRGVNERDGLLHATWFRKGGEARRVVLYVFYVEDE